MTEGHSLRRPIAWVMWGLAVIYVIYKFQTQSSYAVLNARIAESLSLTLAQIGDLGAIYAITYAIVTIPAGGLLDRYGARIVLSTGVAFVALGALVFGLATKAMIVFIGQALMGVGGAFGFPGLAYLTRYWFDIKHFGVIFGVAQTVAATANSLGQAAVGYLILAWGWQDIMLFEAVFGFALLIAFVLIVREPDDGQDEVNSSALRPSFWGGLIRDLKALSVQSLFWQVTLICGLSFGTMLGIGIIWGIKLLEFKGFDSTTASNINSTLWFGFGIGALLIHVISDRLRSFKLTTIVFLLCGVGGLLLLTRMSSMSTTMAYVILIAIGFCSGVNTLCYTMTTRFCEKAISGTAFGFLTCLSFLIAALLMTIPARLVAHMDISFSLAVLIFPAALLVALGLALIKKETYHMTI